MIMDKFEKKLQEISKPEIQELKHQQIIMERILAQNRKTALTWWWAFIPLYVMAAFIMKSWYIPAGGTLTYIKEFISGNPSLSFILFGGLPFLAMLVNMLGVKNIYFYSGSKWFSSAVLKSSLLPLILIVSSAVVAVIYLTLVFN